MLCIKRHKIVEGLDPVKILQEELIPVEKPILGHFREILPFSIVHNSSTSHPFQPNLITVAWRIYRGKGFVSGLIEKDALLASYCQLKTHFLPFWHPIGLPLGCHWQPNWVPIGYQLALNWHRFTTNWVNRRGAIIFCKITYWKIYPIKS